MLPAIFRVLPTSAAAFFCLYGRLFLGTAADMKVAMSQLFCIPRHLKSTKATGFWGPSGALSKINGHLNRLRLQDPLPRWIKNVDPVLLKNAEDFIALYEWRGAVSTDALEVFCELPRRFFIFGSAADSLAEALRTAGCFHGIGSGMDGYGLSLIERVPEVVHSFRWRGKTLEPEVRARAIAYVAACALREMRWKYGRRDPSALTRDVFHPVRESWNGLLLPINAKFIQDMSPFRAPTVD